MEEQNTIYDWQFPPLAYNWITNNESAVLGGENANQQYIMPAVGDGINSVFAPVMYCQQTSQNYVEFLANKAYPEIKKHVSCQISTQMGPSLGLTEPPYLKQSRSEECSHVLNAHPGPRTEASKHPSTAQRKRSREKAYAADRCRRLKISRWLDALQEVVPRPKEAGKAALLDEVIEHVKYLQHQMKELCQSRLGAESTSNSIIFIEGHGHYIIQEQILYGPLEEVMGKLIHVYPSAATELLQSKGLVVMPTTFAEGLLEHTQMLDSQDKGAFDLIPK